MNKTQAVNSLYIKNSMVDTGINAFMGRITGLAFRNIDFDSDSLKTLKEYQGKGRMVYVSYQSANTPLLVLVNLLQYHGLKVPGLALDFTPNVFQMAMNLFQGVSIFFNKITGKKKFEKIPDYDYILDLLRGNGSMVLSLLSRKLFIRRYIDIKSDTLQYLVEAQKQIDEPIFLFPQILFWNQNPERTRPLVTGSATGDRGFLSGIFTVSTSTTPGFVRIPAPINLKEEIEKSPADEPRLIARRIRNRLLDIYASEKRGVLGPVIKSQQEMMEKVLYHKNVLDEIKTMMAEEHQPEKKLRKKAYRYFREIAADFSITMIRWFHRAVQYMFTKIFDGIYYNMEDLRRVREASQRAPLILVPSHKSHMDYLIISSIFYENKIVPPHIVAGSNLTFFPMGPIFRRSGAFFMRRSFKGLRLYPTIFKQYIKTLVSEGYPIEFFIEGGRTRTGKIISPKMGILKYLIDAIEEGYNKDMIFIPITISYDRILEEKSYHMELRGKEKEAESTSAFVKSRKLLKRKYGKVYLTFNEPISFQEYKEKLPEGDDLTTSLGYFISRRISEIIMATPFSIATSAMMQSSASGFTRELLKKRITSLLDYCAFAGVRMSDHLAAAKNYDEIIDYVIISYMQDNIVHEPVSGVKKGGGREVLEGLYILNESDRARINIYRNSILHFFLPATYISIALLCAAEKGEIGEDRLGEVFSDLMALMREEFIYGESVLDTAGSLAKNLEYLLKRSVITREGGMVRIAAGGTDELALFAKGLQDLLESYYIVFDSLSQVSRKMNRRDLMFEVRKNGIKLFHLGEVKLMESLSMPNYENAVALLINTGVIESTPSGKKQVDLDVRDTGKVAQLKADVERYLKPLQKL